MVGRSICELKIVGCASLRSVCSQMTVATNHMPACTTGTYAPTTDEAKVVLCIVAFPGIAIFGYALGQVAGLICLLAEKIVSRISSQQVKEPRKPDMATFTKLLRQHVATNSRIQVPQLVPVIVALEDDFGDQFSKASDRAHNLTAEIEHFYAEVSNSGSHSDGIDILDVLRIVETISIDRYQILMRQKAVQNACALVLVFVVHLVINMALFSHIEGWSLLDALYFCMITCSSVGLVSRFSFFHLLLN
jgi:hypothetical protein